MKRLLAMLLTGCMLVQSLPGSAIMALGAEPDGVITLADGGGAVADVSAEDAFTADTGSDVDLGIVEEVSPGDTLTVPDVSGEDGDLSLDGDGGAVMDEGNTDGLTGDAIIDEIEIVPSVGENGIAEEMDEAAELPEDAQGLFDGEVLEIDDASAGDVTAASDIETTGHVEVTVASGLLFYPEEGLEVAVAALKEDGTEHKSGTVKLDKDNTKGVVRLDVTPGNYTVEVNAPKFASYKQAISVGTRELVKLNISTARSEPVKVPTVNGEATCRSGWLRLGDVENAGKIDHNDIDQILAALHGEDVGNIDADLNENGIVDTADLQIAVQSLYFYKENDEPLSTVEKQQLPLAVKADENTAVTGDLNALLTSAEEGGAPAAPVTLKPANGGKITEDNPVQVSFDLAVEGTNIENLPKLGGMTIQAPGSDGTVDVTGIIDNGEETEEVIYRVPMNTPSPGTIYYAEPEVVEDTVVTVTADDPSGKAEDVLVEEEASALPAEETLSGTDYSQNMEEEIPSLPAEDEIPDITAANGTNAVSDEMEPAELMDPSGADPAEETTENGLRVIEATGARASVAKDGSLVLDFGQQIAVKKVTIKITNTTKGTGDLVDIAKVEFVNDMAQRIPEPEMNIPKGLAGTPANEEFTLTWGAEVNVTGYEIEVTGHVKKTDAVQTQVIYVPGTEYLVVSINEYSLKNFTPYTVRVRSVNGEWSSPWSDPVTVIPKPEGKPDPVDNLKVTGGYRSLSLSWKDMKDANGYMVYYKEKSAADYEPVVAGFVPADPKDTSEAEIEKSGKDRITATSYTITGLPDDTSYYVYVIGWNDLGWGQNPPSTDKIQEAKTTSVDVPQLPKYHAINLPENDAVGVVTPHITGAWRGWAGQGESGATRMVQSPLDEEGGKGNPDPKISQYTAWGTVDNNYESYWTRYDWEDGVVYGPGGYEKGITIQLDQDYDMGYLTFSALDIGKDDPSRASVYYWNTENGTQRQVIPGSIIIKTDEHGNKFYIVKFNRDITANKIQLCTGRGAYSYWLKVAEIRFHTSDDVYNNIMALYADEMHITLNSTHPLLNKPVDEALIAELRTALEEKDPATGELHPLYDSLKLELDYAEKLLKETGLAPLEVDTRLTTAKDGHLGFGGLNAWQPLGKVAATGETLVVYVGHNTKCFGETSDLKMVFTQYHAQSDGLSSEITLKVGRNEITVPEIRNEMRERGGQLYVAYTGGNASDKYTIRISGGSDIPVLNIYKKTGEEKTAAIAAYVEKLKNYVNTIPTKHEELIASAGDKWKVNVNFEYNERNCFLNATDLMMEHMMYSVPALQVWEGIKSNSVAESAQKLEASLDAMEKTMKLFYQHKGLSNNTAANKNAQGTGRNALPVQHLNIRYMTMFSGAFMYASGNHIGVEYPETKMAGGAASWDSFGWGVAHEIGHDINQGVYAIAEITNNYFAQLLTKATSGTRFDYEDIYKKVTSGAKGRSSNVGTQLGLYWQLHLAYDDYTTDTKASYKYAGQKYDCKDDRYIFGDDDYETMFKSLFFARVDTYARNPEKAPHKLTIDSNVDQTLMRLACAAANENILPFFERWGMIPDAVTEEYAKLYGEPTKKALYYVNDGARDYRVAHKDAASTVKDKDVVTAKATAENNVVKINISTTAGDDLLGYEIIRGMYDRGQLDEKQEQVVGFQLAEKGSVYTDTVSTINNRVMYYKVRAVDKFLNYSKAADAGSVKIKTGGALNKDEWSIETTMTSKEDYVAVNPTGDGEYDVKSNADPDSGCYYDASMKPVEVKAAKVQSVTQAIDGNSGTTYVSTSGGDIEIDMHQASGISSVRYIGTAAPTKIFVKETKDAEWTNVKESGITGEAIVKGQNGDPYTTIWFDAAEKEAVGSWIGTYTARYVKLVYDQAVSISEIEVCGPSGDNVEFKSADDGSESGQTVIGILKEDYTYASGTDKEGNAYVIPKGSLIFAGSYTGNPAFNVVILYDKAGNVVGVNEDKTGVEADQVILAKVPEKGNLGTTSDGTWVYYVKEANRDSALKAIKENGNRVRAELYRVDNAQTLAGQRLVSDTILYEIPDSLPEISLTGGKIPGVTE